MANNELGKKEEAQASSDAEGAPKGRPSRIQRPRKYLDKMMRPGTMRGYEIKEK